MSEPYWVAMASAPVDYQGVYDPAVSYAQGAVVTYNGVTYIAVNPSLGQTPPTAIFLQSPPLVTALPGSPADGQEVILCDDVSNPTYQWRLRYVANKTSNKWLFIGGAPIFSLVSTVGTTGSSAYVALASAGPSITVPVAGDYFVRIGCDCDPAGATTIAMMSYDIGATGASDADTAMKGIGSTAGSAGWTTVASERKKTGLAASTALVAKYRTTSAVVVSFQNRWMSVQPVAVGG